MPIAVKDVVVGQLDRLGAVSAVAKPLPVAGADRLAALPIKGAGAAQANEGVLVRRGNRTVLAREGQAGSHGKAVVRRGPKRSDIKLHTSVLLPPMGMSCRFPRSSSR